MLVWNLLTRSTRFTRFYTVGIQAENHEKPLFRSSNPGQKHAAEKRATSDPHDRAAPLRSRENGKRRRREGDRRRPLEVEKLLHLGIPIWKPRKTLLASVLRTKHTAPETKQSVRSEAAPNSKLQLHFVKHLRIFVVSFSKFHWFFCNCCPNFTNFD